MSSGSYTPLSPDALSERLADLLAARPGTVRVALDGPPVAAPHELAASLVAPLRARSRPVAHVRAETFWRDASLRLEHGREDVESYPRWLDAEALRREVLDPVAEGGTYLPSLRDPVSNRSTRAVPRPAPPGTVLVVSGSFLLGRSLPFDRTVHLLVSRGARERRTPAEQAWTLPAFDAYERETDPSATADVVIRADDPRHPAVRGL